MRSGVESIARRHAQETRKYDRDTAGGSAEYKPPETPLPQSMGPL